LSVVVFSLEKISRLFVQLISLTTGEGFGEVLVSIEELLDSPNVFVGEAFYLLPVLNYQCPLGAIRRSILKSR
jgi:hypothetical protein